MTIWLFYCFYAQFKGILINVYTCWVPSMYLYLCKIEMKLFTQKTLLEVVTFPITYSISTTPLFIWNLYIYICIIFYGNRKQFFSKLNSNIENTH